MLNVNVTEQAKRLEEGVRTSAHRAWLAGLGAVALVEEEGKGLLDSSKTFLDDLVKRGEKLEARSKKEMEKARKEAGRVRGQVERNLDQVTDEIDRRVTGALHRIGVPTRSEIQALTRRVEELTAKTAGKVPAAATPAGLKVYHVTWADEQWKVEAEGATRATSVHPTKDEAVAAARELAHAQEPSQVVVYKMDGTVQTRYAYEPADA